MANELFLRRPYLQLPPPVQSAAPLLPSERLAVRDKQSRLAVVSPFTGARCSFIHIKIKPGARGHTRRALLSLTSLITGLIIFLSLSSPHSHSLSLSPSVFLYLSLALILSRSLSFSFPLSHSIFRARLFVNLCLSLPLTLSLSFSLSTPPLS